jgi:polysaccharide deacetylase 2 family uncharacterized protein YibQ
MKKFSRLKRSSYSIFTVFIFLLIFSIFLGFTFYFINSIFNKKNENDIVLNIKNKNRGFESENIAKKMADRFTIKNAPDISILVTGLGLDKEVTNSALNKLPDSISLGFLAYSNNLEYADITNRDLLMNIPMETYDYFFKDNGPYSLICKLGEANNSERLNYIMSKSLNFNGYYTGAYESFTDDIKDLDFLLKKINETRKYVLYNDPKEIKSYKDVAIKLGMKDKILKVDIIINKSMSETKLEKRLNDLKLIAKAKGHAIAMINANIYNIDILEKWIKNIAKSLEYNIVSVSELREKINKKEMSE